MSEAEESVRLPQLLEAKASWEQGSLDTGSYRELVCRGLSADEAVVSLFAVERLFESPGVFDGVESVVAEALLDRFESGYVPQGFYVHLREQIRADPGAFMEAGVALGEHLGATDTSNGHWAVALGLLEVLGAAAPGAVKPAVDALVEPLLADNGDATRTGGWTLVRAATTESAVVRPFVAERLWELDSEGDTTVDALEALGAVGWVLPEEIPTLEPIVDLTTAADPETRAAAIESLGKIVGRPRVDGEPFGTAAPSLPSEATEPIRSGLSAGSPAVREAAVRTVRLIVEADPSRGAAYAEQLGAFVTADGNESTESDLGEKLDALLASIKGEEEDDLLRDAVETLETAAPTPDWVFAEVAAIEDGTDLAAGLRARLLDAARETGNREPAVELTDAVFDSIAAGESLSSASLTADERRLAGALAECSAEHAVAESYADRLQTAIRDDPAAATGGEVMVLTELALLSEPPVRPESVCTALIEALRAGPDGATGARCRALELLARAEPILRERIASALVGTGALLREGEAAAAALAATEPTVPGAVADGVRQLCTAARCLDDAEEDVSNASVQAGYIMEGIKTLSSRSPEAAADAAGRLCNVAIRKGIAAEAAVRGIIEIRSMTEAADSEVTDALTAVLNAEGVSTLEVTMCVAVLLGDPSNDQRDRASVLLQFLLPYYPAGLDTLGTLDSDSRGAIAAVVAQLVDAVEPEHYSTIASVVTNAPDCTVPLQTMLDGECREVARQLADPSVFAPLATIADRLPNGGAVEDGGPETLFVGGQHDPTLDAFAFLGAIDPDAAVDPSWTRHPDPAVREAARAHRRGEHEADTSGEAAVTDPSAPGFVDSLRQRLAGEAPATARTALLAAARAGELSRTRALTCLFGHLTRAEDEAERRETAATIDRLRSFPVDDPDEPTDTAGRGTDDGRDTVWATLGKCLYDGNGTVRLRAATVLGGVDGQPTGRLRERIEDRIENGSLQLAGRLCFVCAEAGITVDAAVVAARLSDATGGPSIEMNRNGCRLLRELVGSQPAAVDEVEPAVRTELDADDPITRGRAKEALARTVQAADTPPVAALDAIVSTFVDDSELDPTLAEALAAYEAETIPDPAAVVAQCLELSRETDRSRSRHVASGLLERIARETPERAAAGFDGTTAAALADGDVDEMIVELHLYRALAALGTVEPSTVERFREPIETTLSNTGGTYESYEENTGEKRPLSADVRALRESAAEAAGNAGLDCFVVALESFPADDTRPNVDATATARFLLNANRDPYERALDLLEGGPLERARAVALALAELDIDSDAIARRKRRLACIERLLNRTDDVAATRPAVRVALAATDADEATIRAVGVETAHAICRHGPLTATELLGTLLPALRDPNPSVQGAAAAALPDAVRNSPVALESVVEGLFADATCGDSMARRRGAVIALGRLGTRFPACRRRAAEGCHAALDTTDRLLERHALAGLESISEVSPRLVRPYLDAIRRRQSADSPSTASIANTIVERLTAA
jgi:hypothetical protein